MVFSCCFNRPFLRPKKPHFQSVARYTPLFDLRIRNHFHIEGFTFGFVLKQRLGGIQKYPIYYNFYYINIITVVRITIFYLFIY